MPMRLPQNNVDLRGNTSGAPEHRLPCSNCSSCQPQQGCYHSNSIASQRGPRPKSSIHCFGKGWATQKVPSTVSLEFKCTLERSTKSPCETGSRKEMKGSWDPPPQAVTCCRRQMLVTVPQLGAEPGTGQLSLACSLWLHDLTASE